MSGQRREGGPVDRTSGGEERCRRCGSDQVQLAPAGAVRRLLRWVTHGRPVPDMAAQCRKCGLRWLTDSEVSSSFVYTGHKRLHRPRQLIRVVLGHRHWEPNPALYLGAAAVGTAVGVLTNVLWGVPWWIGTGSGPLTILALSIVSAIRNPKAQRSLKTELLGVLAPDRYLQRVDDEQERLIRSADLPLFGIAGSEDWFRFMGGTTRSGDRLNAIELGHRLGGPNGDVEMRIETRRPRLQQTDRDRLLDPEQIREHDQRVNRAALTSWIARHMAKPEGPPPADTDAIRTWHERWRQRARDLEQQLETRRWQTRTLEIDGQPHHFETLAADNTWAATTRIDGLHVNLHAHSIEPNELTIQTIDDPSPYLEGTRQLRRVHRTD